MNLLVSSSVTDNIKDSVKLASKYNLGLEISRIPNQRSIDEDFNTTILQLQKALLGFEGYKTLHGLFFDLSVTSIDPAIKLISQRRHQQSFEIGKAIGADIIVFHSGNKGMKHKAVQAKFKENLTDYWKENIKRFEDANITAVIENVHEKHPDMLFDVIKEVNSPYLKLSLDTGHANLFSKLNISEWIKKYSNYLHHMHIHNNFNDDDSHSSLTNGTIDFVEVLDELKKLNLNPVIVFEMFTENELIESLTYYKKACGEKVCPLN